MTVSQEIIYVVDLNVDFNINLDRIALRPNQTMMSCVKSVPLSSCLGGWGEGGRLERTFETSLGVITVSLSSCMIGDAHFRAPGSNSRSYPLLTFKCVALRSREKEKFVICAEEGQNTWSVLVFSCGNVNKNTCREWKKSNGKDCFLCWCRTLTVMASFH